MLYNHFIGLSPFLFEIITMCLVEMTTVLQKVGNKIADDTEKELFSIVISLTETR